MCSVSCFLKALNKACYIYTWLTESWKHLKNVTVTPVQSECINWVTEIYYICHICNISGLQTMFFLINLGLVMLCLGGGSHLFHRKYHVALF